MTKKINFRKSSAQRAEIEQFKFSESQVIATSAWNKNKLSIQKLVTDVIHTDGYVENAD